ncbi:transposase [Rhodanobacter geophilus]|uniref:Transposase n=1 Tax=Rhodanobacter geophilus TaxID=3162488 RepID=A0ABV3QK55_9GAMM
MKKQPKAPWNERPHGVGVALCLDTVGTSRSGERHPALGALRPMPGPYWCATLSRVHWPTHTGRLQGINNRIKIVKRIAYGYRVDAYFFLKIRNAFSGLG